MANEPKIEFGKRRPAPIPLGTAQPVKRSRHVALLVMGTMAIGGGAYALMPGERCEPKGAGMAGPALPQTEGGCPPRGYSSNSGHSGGTWSTRSYFFGDASSNGASSGTSAASGSSEVSRGGFGGFARAFAAHFSGG